MNKFFQKLFGIEPNEASRVYFLLLLGFTMGVFLEYIGLASFTLFIQKFDEETDLPVAFVLSGTVSMVLTSLYNFLQARMNYKFVAIITSVFLCLTIGLILFGFEYYDNEDWVYYASFVMILPFTFLGLLLFWGIFGRVFNLRQSKKIIGTIDTGQLIASLVALFSIPILLQVMDTVDLITVSLVSSVAFMVVITVICFKFPFLDSYSQDITGKKQSKTISYANLFRNKYMALMAGFVIISMIAINFLDYGFANVGAAQYPEEKDFANFLALFEASIVIFGFLFQTFVTDYIIAIYGLRISLIINPLLIIIFTGAALFVGFTFGYVPESETFIYFFLIIAISKFFIDSINDALDGPAFKLYFLPVDGNIRFDVQTKIEGVITALATVIAGGIIILINNIEIFDLITVIMLLVPVLLIWFFITNKMHFNYRSTLRETLVKNKAKGQVKAAQEYSTDTVLQREVHSESEDKVIYGLNLMEKLEPALFESTILSLSGSDSLRLRQFAEQKIKFLDLELDDLRKHSQEVQALARKAKGESEDHEMLSIPAEKLARLAKSIRQEDRLLAAKLLRKLINNTNIFILLELLRDIDPRVRMAAILTARRVKRPETWSILIEMLNSQVYSHAAASALKEAGEAVLITLENAFHKSGQSLQIMLKIVQIMGRIGGPEAMKMLWAKIDFPDKHIVGQILLSFRMLNIHAEGKEANTILGLLEAEIAKAIWNMAAITEITDEAHYHYLHQALQEEVDENIERIFMLLSILYDPQSVQLVRENIETGTSDGIAFAIELMDLFLSNELKPKLFPLFDDISIKDKISKLQIHFPRENYSAIQMLNFLLNRDFNQNNRWTKACVIHAVAFMPEFRISKGLIAQLFNPDRMLQEAAGWVIYNKDKESFYQILDRVNPKDRRFLEESIQRNKLIDGLDDGYFLRIEMVMHLRSIAQFSRIKGNLLCDLVDKIITHHLKKAEDIKLDSTELNRCLYIVAEGSLEVYHDTLPQFTLRRKEVFGDIFYHSQRAEATLLQSVEDHTVVFEIALNDFYQVMANHHELTQEFMDQVTTPISLTID